MEQRAIEILAIKLAQAEANNAILQARLEESDKKLAELEMRLEAEQEAHDAEHKQDTEL